LKSDPLTAVDGICRRVHKLAIGVVHYARYPSDSIHLSRPRSDSDPIIVHSLALCHVKLACRQTRHAQSHRQEMVIAMSIPKKIQRHFLHSFVVPHILSDYRGMITRSKAITVHAMSHAESTLQRNTPLLISLVAHTGINSRTVVDSGFFKSGCSWI